MCSCRPSFHSSLKQNSCRVWCWSHSLHRTGCLAGQRNQSPRLPKKQLFWVSNINNLQMDKNTTELSSVWFDWNINFTLQQYSCNLFSLIYHSGNTRRSRIISKNTFHWIILLISLYNNTTLCAFIYYLYFAYVLLRNIIMVLNSLSLKYILHCN